MGDTAQRCQWGRCPAPATEVVIYPALAWLAPRQRAWSAGEQALVFCAACATLAREEVAESWPRAADPGRA
jgi:hypothetical protein